MEKEKFIILSCITTYHQLGQEWQYERVKN